MKKVEIKLDNERQERLKLCDKKSLEIAGVEAKAKIQIHKHGQACESQVSSIH